MDIPLHSSPDGSTMYQVLFDNGTSASIPLGDMASLIPRPPVLGGAHLLTTIHPCSLLSSR
jgi:hypothetical protein